MITLITGTPGSGKTLFAVTKILEYVEQNKKLLQDGKEPRMIYADIDGLNIEGVEPAPKDWRDTPDGSVIFYDEIQQRDEYKKSRYDNEICDALQVHRHTGHDIYGITQFPVLLHPNFRAVVGMHHHLHRGWGLSAATVYNWAYCVDAPNAPSNKKLAEHTFRFNYDKGVYKYYKSATVHTHKARVPKRIFALFFIVAILGYFAYSLLSSKNNYLYKLYGSQETKTNSDSNSKPENKTIDLVSTPTQQPNSDIQPQQEINHEQNLQNRRIYLYEQDLHKDYEIRRADPALQVRGVMKMGNKCIAYNAYNDVMNLSKADCESYVGTGRVFSPNNHSQQLPSQPTYTANETVLPDPLPPTAPTEPPAPTPTNMHVINN